MAIAQPSDVTTLSDYADAVLGVAIESLNMTTAGAPDRAYVSPAQPTFDCCPMLTVVVTGLDEADTSPTFPAEAPARRTDFGNVILASYEIWAIRCAPVINGGELPSPSEIAASALEVQEDGWALWNGLREAIRANDLFDGCLGIHVDGGNPINEQGGCVGWVFRLRASIPGIPAS